MQKCFSCGVTPEMNIVDFETPKSIFCVYCQAEDEADTKQEEEEGEKTT